MRCGYFRYGPQTKVREISKFISYENNERLCINSLFDQNDHFIPIYLKIDCATFIFIDSLSINDVAILDWFEVSEKE